MDKLSFNLLQRLADICRDGERELMSAANEITDGVAQQRFRSAAARYAAAASEIDDAIETLGGDALTTGTFAGFQRLALARIKRFFFRTDDAALILSLGHTEDLAECCYEEAMNKDLPGFVSIMLQRHYSELFESDHRAN